MTDITNRDRTLNPDYALDTTINQPDSDTQDAVSLGVAVVSGGLAGAVLGNLVAGRVGTVIGAVMGGVAGAAIGQETGDRLSNAVETVKDKIDEVKPSVTHAIDSAKQTVSQKVEDVKPSVTHAIDSAKQSISNATDSITHRSDIPDAQNGTTIQNSTDAQSINPVMGGTASDVATSTPITPTVEDYSGSGVPPVAGSAVAATPLTPTVDAYPGVGVPTAVGSVMAPTFSTDAVTTPPDNDTSTVMQATPTVPNSTVDEQYELGLTQAREGHLANAIATFQSVIAQEPDCAEAHYNLGVVLGKHGFREQGIEHIRMAKQLCEQQGRTQEAENVDHILQKLGVA